ncbi:hypothetical protein [Campylobacter gastrosuis]|uniref:Uncharacterized protein n=1 Tax=Campylobacter gastrosuis TaxID=2974576 RepID=A0ABT7HQG1_9BACT|nr:hypothetical protein [Campylobacter gastrosuis]MDL0089098.1 hypothetical protein [Campylobacter gastrosuis]
MKITQVSIKGVDKYFQKSDYISSLITQPSGFSFTSDTIERELNRTISNEKLKVQAAIAAKIKLENVGKEGLNSDEKEALAKFYPDALNQSSNTNNKEITNMQNLHQIK